MRTALLIFTSMTLLGIVCAVFLKLPLPPLTSPGNPPAPTQEERNVQMEAEGKLKAARVILAIVEDRLNSGDALESARGQYLQALTEFELHQWPLSLRHTLTTIQDLVALYETTISPPL